MSEISIFLTLSFVIFASPYIAKFLRLPIAPTEIILGIIFKNIGILGESEILKLVRRAWLLLFDVFSRNKRGFKAIF